MSIECHAANCPLWCLELHYLPNIGYHVVARSAASCIAYIQRNVGYSPLSQTRYSRLTSILVRSPLPQRSSRSALHFSQGPQICVRCFCSPIRNAQPTNFGQTDPLLHLTPRPLTCTAPPAALLTSKKSPRSASIC